MPDIAAAHRYDYAARLLFLLGAGTCMLVVACGSPQPAGAPSVTGAAEQPPPPPGPMNGTYNGILTLASGPALSCGTQDTLSLQVRNGTFSYVLMQPQVPWQPRRVFQVTIKTDGSFQAQSGAAYMQGVVRGGHMQGQIVGDACGYQFEADGTGTW